MRKLIDSKKLNESDVRATAGRTIPAGQSPDQNPAFSREVTEYWLTRAQAQKVVVYSETDKGDEMLDLLIADSSAHNRLASHRPIWKLDCSTLRIGASGRSYGTSTLLSRSASSTDGPQPTRTAPCTRHLPE